MKNLSKFQLILLIVFGLFIIVGILVFALTKAGTDDSQTEVTIWGTMPASLFDEVLKRSNLDKNLEIKFTYTAKQKESFDIEFLEALAEGRAPDLFFVSEDTILKYQPKIFQIPFKSFSERAFKNSFVEGAEIFLDSQGILAMPILIDPLVMYWNRDILTSEGLVQPPEFWDEFYDLSPKLTVKDSGLNIRRSAVALGEFINISNAFEILSALIMQAGNPVTEKSGGQVAVVLGEAMGLPALPAERALSFYTDFSNPLKPFYSWNRANPWSENYFLSGDLAVYFGFASELNVLRDKNPNLNFDLAPLPQVRDSQRKTTYGKMVALAINKNSPNIGPAFTAATLLSRRESVLVWSEVTNLPPIRRDLLSLRPERAYMEVFYDGALSAKAWVIPDRIKVGEIWKEMIESVTGGRSRTREAVGKATGELKTLFEKR